MRYLMVFFLVFLMASRSLMANQLKPLNLASGEWPPWSGEKLTGQGIASYFVAEIFKRAGYKVTYRYMPWKRALIMGATNEYHGTLHWSKNQERSKDYLYTQHYKEGIQVFYHRKDFSFALKGLPDLNNYKVAVARGYFYGEEIQQLVDSKTINPIVVKDETQGLTLLHHKRVDVFPASFDTAQTLLGTTLAEISPNITYHNTPFRQTLYHVLLKRKNTSSREIVERFNKALAKYLEEKGARWVLRPCKGDSSKDTKLTGFERDMLKELCPKRL